MRLSYKLGEEHVFVDDEFKDLTIFCYDCNRKNFVTLYNIPFLSRPQYFHYKIPCAYCGKETVLSVIKNNDITKYIITPLIFAEIHNIANFESNIIIKKRLKMRVNEGLLISKNRGINKILIKAETKELTDSMSIFLQLLIDYNETIKKGATEKRVYEDILKAVIDEYKFRMFGNYND